MADRIKGITVVLGGDTTGLNKALKGTNKEIKNTQSQLKDVERLLKLDPTNTKLLEQRQRLLANAVGDTKTKLDTLKQAEKQVQEQFKRGEVSQQQYDGLQREIVQTQQELKRLENQAKSSNAVLSKISGTANKISSASGKIAGTMAPAAAAIVGVGALSFNAASDVAESMNKVEVAFGDSADEVKKFAEETLDTYGIAKGTALDMAATFGDMGTSMGLSHKDAAKMATSLVGLAGDLSSFKNIGVDQAMTALNGIFTGETESLKTLGVVMTQANLDAYAMANGFGKTTKDMTEAQKVQLRYAYVLNATQNAQGDFANTSDGAANSLRVMKESAKEASAEFGEALLPVITPIIQKVTDLIKWFSSLDDGQKSVIVTVAALIAAISPVAGIISAISGAISFIVANPIVLLIGAIVALVSLIAVKGDEIQAILQKVDDFLQGIFARDWTEVFGPTLGNVLNAFFKVVKDIWDSIKRVFDGVIDFIRGVFTGDWERAWNGVKNIFGGIFDSFVSLAKAPLNGIIGLLNGAIGAINSLINGFNQIGFDMPNWLGGGSWHPNIPNIPNIPFLAKGGILSQGSAVVGEAGPELLTMAGNRAVVQPLSSGNTTNNNLGGVNITVYGAPGQDIHALANILMDEFESVTARKAAVF